MSPLIAAVDFGQGIENAWNDVASFVPKLAAFLVILLVGYVVVKAIAKALDKVLDRVGFDKAVERGGIAKAMSKSNYDASDLVSKVAFYGLFLFVLNAAFGVFGPNPVGDMLGTVISYLPNAIAALLIVVITSAIAAAVREVIQASLGGTAMGTPLANAAGIAIIGFGVFAALNQLQIAPAIVNGLFYAILATVVGVTVISVGASGIKPMQSRWENALSRYDEEKGNVRSQMQGARGRIDMRAEELKSQAQSATASQER